MKFFADLKGPERANPPPEIIEEEFSNKWVSSAFGRGYPFVRFCINIEGEGLASVYFIFRLINAGISNSSSLTELSTTSLTGSVGW